MRNLFQLKVLPTPQAPFIAITSGLSLARNVSICDWITRIDIVATLYSGLTDGARRQNISAFGHVHTAQLSFSWWNAILEWFAAYELTILFEYDFWSHSLQAVTASPRRPGSEAVCQQSCPPIVRTLHTIIPNRCPSRQQLALEMIGSNGTS